MIGVLVIIVAIIIGLTKAIGGKGDNKQEITTAEETTSELQTTEPVTDPEPEPTTEAVTEEPTTVAPADIVKTPAEEDFTNESFFEGAVFVGDAFVEGIDLYQFLDSKQLIFDRNWTTGKAEANALDKVAASNATKVFLEIGINDLNNGWSADRVFESYKELVDGIKGKLPSAEIYVISLFPVTSGFEAKENISIKNTEVASLNEMLAGMEGITFLNVNKSIADAEGNLPDVMSSSGLNIKKGYYGFILNLIAEMCQ